MEGVHIYLDVDDVLAETTRAIAALARHQFGREVAFDDMTVFDLRVSLGFGEHEIEAFMQEVHREDFLLGLPPMQGAARAVADWHAAGAEISIVTGRPPESRAATERWLETWALPFHQLELVDKYGRYGTRAAVTKQDLAARDYTLVVEDSVEMADFLIAHTRATVLLMDRPWNRNAPLRGSEGRIRRIHDWGEAVIECAGLFAPEANSI